jgi:hypothetical protein
MVKIYDNIISKKEQEEIKKTLIFESQSKNFGWYFLPDITKTGNKYQNRSGFIHIFLREEKINSYFYKLIEPIITKTAKKIKIKIENILLARGFLQLPLNKEYVGKGVDTPHIDRTEKHLVFLYYVCDSDGDTIIYNYRSKDKNDIPFFEDIKELKRVTPKQGRVVVFNGLHWHTAEQPTKDVRCIINFNINGKNIDK